MTKFTDKFAFGQRVRVVRHSHGWPRNGLVGTITEISDRRCEVLVDGIAYEIEHPRDLRPV